MVSAGQHRQKVAGVTGQVELQDATGKKLANLGDLPKMGRSLDVNIVTNMTGLLRLAAIGTLTFADGTKAPFVVRSRGYVVPAAK